MNIRRYLAILAAACFAGGVPGCGWPTDDDAGDESLVRQAVPIIQGRKIRGHTEVKLLTDIIEATDRETVLYALMQQPDYVDHWSEVLVDQLSVHREPESIVETEPRLEDCYGDPLLTGAPNTDLAWDVMFNPPNTQLSGTFNMSDLVRSALVLDDIYPVYAAHLFAMELQGRDNSKTTLGTLFGHVYLHRDISCLSCHNSETSASGESTGWDRTHPIRGYFERALYGSSAGAPGDNAFAVFRTDVVDDNGIEPWGMQNCGKFATTVSSSGPSAQFAGLTGKNVSIFDLRNVLHSGQEDLSFNGLQRTFPPEVAETCSFCEQTCNGSIDAEALINSAIHAGDVKDLLTDHDWSASLSGDQTCWVCHGGQGDLYLSGDDGWANELVGYPSLFEPSKKRVAPGNSAHSYLLDMLQGTGVSQMPPYGTELTPGQISMIKEWIDDLPPEAACGICPTVDCSEGQNFVAPHEALAFLTATNATNNIWTEAMGWPLTIGNYFPRNNGQYAVLRDMVEYRFVPKGWSVQSVLLGALGSYLFNRATPAASQLNGAYLIPPLFNPWNVADPRVPPVTDPDYEPGEHAENHFNAMGESINRYSAHSLLRAIHKTLDWPAAERFPSSGYPNSSLQRALGQYFSETTVGFRGTDLQGLLFWENIHGACDKPSNAGTDWIDRLVTSINGFDPADPGGPLTVGDVVVVMRDWFLGDGTISSTAAVGLAGSEVSNLIAYFGVASLDEPISGVAQLEDKLRGYCGVLVESPQFMLAGAAPQGLGPEPRIRVCNSEPCTYLEMCVDLSPGLALALGNTGILICNEDSVFFIPSPPPVDVIWIDWCFGIGCGLLVDKVPEGCYTEILRPGSGASCELEAPSCDVRLSSVGICGGPISPMMHRRGQRPLVVAWAEGVRVDEASGVKIRSVGSSRFEDLREGYELRHGDLLAVPRGASLRFSGQYAEVATPRGGAAGLPHDALFISIAGEAAVARQEVSEETALPAERIRRIRASWGKYGEAGSPLTREEYESYQLQSWEVPGPGGP